MVDRRDRGKPGSAAEADVSAASSQNASVSGSYATGPCSTVSKRPARADYIDPSRRPSPDDRDVYDELDITPQIAAAASRFRIADCHCHIYPKKIAAKAVVSTSSFYDLRMHNASGDADTLVSKGSLIGCERYVVCSVATSASQVESINRFIAAECAQHPEFLGLGAWHEDVEDLDALLDQVQELGLVGIKVHPDLQKVDIDGPALVSLYSALVERDMPVLVHMGDARYEFSSPRKLASILERFDRLRIDAAHLGGWNRWDEAVSCLAGSQAFYDISSSIAFMGIEWASEVAHAYGADRLMFGVDFPMWNHVAEFDRVMRLGFTDEELEGIFYGNFAKLYGLE